MSRMNRGIVSPTTFRTPQPNNPQFVQVAPQVAQFNQLQQIMTGIQRTASAFGSYAYNEKRAKEREEASARREKYEVQRERDRQIRADSDKVIEDSARWWAENPDAEQTDYQAYAYDQRDASTTLASNKAWNRAITGTIPRVQQEQEDARDRQVSRYVLKLRTNPDLSATDIQEAIRDAANNSFDPKTADIYLGLLPEAMQREITEDRRVRLEEAEAARKQVTEEVAGLIESGASDMDIEAILTEQWKSTPEGSALRNEYAQRVPGAVASGDREREERAKDKIDELITKLRLPEMADDAPAIIEGAIASKDFTKTEQNRLRAELPQLYNAANESAVNKVAIQAIQAESTEALGKIVGDFLEGPFGNTNAAVSMARILQQKLDKEEVDEDRANQITTMIKALNVVGNEEEGVDLRLEQIEAMINASPDPETQLALTRLLPRLQAEGKAADDLSDRADTLDQVVAIGEIPTAAGRLDAWKALWGRMSDEERVAFGARYAAVTAAVREEQAGLEEAARDESINRFGSLLLPQYLDQADPELQEGLSGIYGSDDPDANSQALDFISEWVRTQEGMTEDIANDLAKTIQARMQQWHRQSDDAVAQEQTARAGAVLGSAQDMTMQSLSVGNDSITEVLETATNTFNAFRDDWGSSSRYWDQVVAGINTHFNELSLEEQGSFLSEMYLAKDRHSSVTEGMQQMRARFVDSSIRFTMQAQEDRFRAISVTPEGLNLLTSFVEDQDARTQFVDEAVGVMGSTFAGEEYRNIRGQILSEYRAKIQEQVDRSIKPLRTMMEKRQEWLVLDEAQRLGSVMTPADRNQHWEGDRLQKALYEVLDQRGPQALSNLRALVNGSDEVAGLGSKFLNRRSALPTGLVQLVDGLVASEDPHKVHQAAIIVASSRMHTGWGDAPNSAALRYAIGEVYPPGQRGEITVDETALSAVSESMNRFQEAMIIKEDGNTKWDESLADLPKMAGAVATFLGESFTSSDAAASLKPLTSNSTFMAHFILSEGDSIDVKVNAALAKMQSSGHVLERLGNEDRPVYNFVYDPQGKTRIIPELRELTQEEDNRLLPWIRERGAQMELDDTNASNIPWESLSASDIEIRFNARDFVDAEPGFYPVTVAYAGKDFTMAVPATEVTQLQQQQLIDSRSVQIGDVGDFEFTNLAPVSFVDWFHHTIGRDSIFPWGTNSMGYYPASSLTRRENIRQKETWTPRPEKPKREFPPNQ